MPNQNWTAYTSDRAAPAGGRSTAPQGGKPSARFKEKPGFPRIGLPGKGGPDRSAGTPKRSKFGAPFHVDKEGFD